MLFDEPASPLDPKLREARHAMCALAHDGMATTVVAHQGKVAVEVANQMMFMDRRCGSQKGDAVELYAKPESHPHTFLRLVVSA